MNRKKLKNLPRRLTKMLRLLRRRLLMRLPRRKKNKLIIKKSSERRGRPTSRSTKKP